MCPEPPAAFHGGIARLFVRRAICVACGLAAWNVSRLNGAEPSGRWHWAHLLKMMGATSLVKVT